MGLTWDNNGIPNDVATKVQLTKTMVEKAAKYGITPDRIHIDPCVMALSTENNSLLNKFLPFVLLNNRSLKLQVKFFINA